MRVTKVAADHRARLIDLMISSAEPLMKPESAGRDRNRTKNASRSSPMTHRTSPTSRAHVAARADRSSGVAYSRASCSLTTRDTRPPVPIDASWHVPSSA